MGTQQTLMEDDLPCLEPILRRDGSHLHSSSGSQSHSSSAPVEVFLGNILDLQSISITKTKKATKYRLRSGERVAIEMPMQFVGHTG